MDHFEKYLLMVRMGNPTQKTVDDNVFLLGGADTCCPAVRKPTRVMPYVFLIPTLGYGVYDGGRAYDRAKAAAPETSSQSTMLRELPKWGSDMVTNSITPPGVMGACDYVPLSPAYPIASSSVHERNANLSAIQCLSSNHTKGY